MQLKELDQTFGEILAPHLTLQNFKGRGKGGSRHWHRQVAPGIQQLIVTPCVPARLGGGYVSCGVAVRFDDVEEELARLTIDSHCFKPSSRSATVGTTLESLRSAGVKLFRPHLSDIASTENAVDELAPLLNEFAIPWLDRMIDYETAYRELCAGLVRYPIGHTVDVTRTFLLARKLGLRLDDPVLRHLRRIVDTDDIGADVCRRILELNKNAIGPHS